MSETCSSQVPCCVEHFTYWPKVCKEVLCAVGVKNSLCIEQYLFFNFVTTILETLFNICNVFSHCFGYLLNRLLCPASLLVGLSILLIIRIVYESLRTQLFRKDFHTGISSLWYFLLLTCWSAFIYFFMVKPKNFSCDLPDSTIAPQYQG